MHRTRHTCSEGSEHLSHCPPTLQSIEALQSVFRSSRCQALGRCDSEGVRGEADDGRRCPPGGRSRALVSLALRDSGKVSATSRAAVIAAADELGYRPNSSPAISPASRRTLGLLINDLHNPYFPGVADGVKHAADRRGYRLLLNSAPRTMTTSEPRSRRSSTFAGRDHPHRRTPAGDRHRAPQRPRRSSSSAGRCVRRSITINNDDRLGATFAIEHLVELGHRHIWHIDGGRGAGWRSAPCRVRGDDAQIRVRTARARRGVHRIVGVKATSGRWGRAARSQPSSPATTSARSGPSTRSTRSGSKCPTTSRSSATTTRSSPR